MVRDCFVWNEAYPAKHSDGSRAGPTSRRSVSPLPLDFRPRRSSSESQKNVMNSPFEQQQARSGGRNRLVPRGRWSSRGSATRGEVRPGLLIVVAVLLAVVIGAALWFRRPASRRTAAQPTATQPETRTATAAAQPGESSKPRLTPRSPLGSGEPGAPDTVATRPSKTSPAAPAPARAVPSAETRHLVAVLSRLESAKTPWTPEEAAKWKETLQQLIQQGAAGVPAILEFLDKNADVTFGKPGSELTGYSSARAAMFDALVQIGGEEGISGTLQALQATGDPREIAILAQNLEKLAPEQYRQEALAAARETLGLAAAGKLQGTDVAPLFEVLQRFGGSAAVADLEQAAGQWKYYSAFALAQLPEGAGVPSLVRLAQDPQSGGHDTALQMLAMLSTQSPDARATLLEQARVNGISSSSWYAIGPFLAGDQIRFADSGFEGPIDSDNVRGLKTTHIQFGNQNYYSAPALLSPEEATRRLALIDELLAVNSSPAARDALQRAQAALSARLAQLTPAGNTP